MSEGSTTRYFYELTPSRIHQAFSQAGLELQPTVRFLNSMENRVVGVEDEEGERWVGKFYRPGRWSRSALLEEHDFLFELFREGLPVHPAIELSAGETVGEICGIYFAIFRHHFGRMPDEIGFEHVDVLGELLARLHLVGERRSVRHRPTVGPASWGLSSLEAIRQEGVVPMDLLERYSRLVRELVGGVEQRFGRHQFIRLHGDLHRGNILWTSLGPQLVDFDDMGMGPAVQDLWMLIPGRDNEALALREIFLEAYRRVRPFERSELELIEPLRALKFVRYAAWVARRRKDPAFVRLFPDVESRSFWRREVEELEAQLRLLER
ncbi:MAG: serine/threonine protein kinase [Armatimonadetes bacterium]|nr:serine/threonine protein kinase [Armatimonadota bacterium]